MNDVIAGAVIVALSLLALLVWAVTEGLLTRARRREQDRDDLADGLGVMHTSNPYLRPWRDRRPGDLGGGAA